MSIESKLFALAFAASFAVTGSACIVIHEDDGDEAGDTTGDVDPAVTATATTSTTGGTGAGTTGTTGMGTTTGVDSTGQGTTTGAGTGDEGFPPLAGGWQVEQILGYYTDVIGTGLYLTTSPAFPGEVLAVYDHDLGTARLRVVDGRLAGWWCEDPSRVAPEDAGLTQFDAVVNQIGELLLDGRWMYGTDGAWAEDWDFAFVDKVAPQELAIRVDRVEQFCAMPTH